MTDAAEHERQQHERDATTFFLLGGFFIAMGALVLIGTLWTLERPHAMVVNFVSGLVLFVIGLGMTSFGLVLKRRAAPTKP